MSRVGKKPIEVPPGVKVAIQPGRIEFESPKGKSVTPLHDGITARLEANRIVLERANDTKPVRSLHGLDRSLAQNAVVGLTQGFQKQLEIVGVGYRAKVEKGRLEMNLGYSRPVVYEIPQGIEIVAEKPTLLTVRGTDKQLVGQVAVNIKRFRIPDPYKQKGIRYVGEKLIKKERKAGVAGA
jgi:large subunit ribosomal protein L6